MKDALLLATDHAKEFEDCVTPLCHRYPTGFWTIGYGNTVLGNGHPVTDLTKPITQDEADTLLLQTLRNVQKQLSNVVKPALTPPQDAALISLTYNIGIGNFERSTLLKLLNAGKINQAARGYGLFCAVERHSVMAWLGIQLLRALSPTGGLVLHNQLVKRLFTLLLPLAIALLYRRATDTARTPHK